MGWGRGVILAILLLTNAASARAAIVINEFLPDPPSGQNEWVELYNTGPESIDLSPYLLEDDKNREQPLAALGQITAGAYVVYKYSGDGWLNNGGDTLYLKNSSGTIDHNHIPGM